jgi:hypothetical protein
MMGFFARPPLPAMHCLAIKGPKPTKAQSVASLFLGVRPLP